MEDHVTEQVFAGQALISLNHARSSSYLFDFGFLTYEACGLRCCAPIEIYISPEICQYAVVRSSRKNYNLKANASGDSPWHIIRLSSTTITFTSFTLFACFGCFATNLCHYRGKDYSFLHRIAYPVNKHASISLLNVS
jgi:hypothetical protein